MIHTYLNNFAKYEREINTLFNLLLFMLVILALRVCFLLYAGHYDESWNLLAPGITLVSAMIIARSANRLIENGRIAREEGRRAEIVQVIHHLIVITKDLKQRVRYAKKSLSDGDRPIFTLIEIARSIEKRYETLYEKDVYKFLPGDCVDIVINISGSIYGLVTLANGINIATSNNKMIMLKNLPNSIDMPTNESILKLEVEIQSLIDKLFTLRLSLDSEEQCKSKGAETIEKK